MNKNLFEAKVILMQHQHQVRLFQKLILASGGFKDISIQDIFVKFLCDVAMFL